MVQLFLFGCCVSIGSGFVEILFVWVHEEWVLPQLPVGPAAVRGVLAQAYLLGKAWGETNDDFVLSIVGPSVL